MACRLGQPLPWDETRRDPSQSQSVFIWGGESVEDSEMLKIMGVSQSFQMSVWRLRTERGRA